MSSAKIVKRCIANDLPLDCWSKVVEFLALKDELIPLFYVVKGLFQHLKTIAPQSTKNVVFTLFKLPKKEQLHVTNITSANLKTVNIISQDDYESAVSDFFKCYEVENANDVLRKFNSLFPRLYVLEVNFCWRFNENWNVTRGMHDITLDNSFRYDSLVDLSLTVCDSTVRISQFFPNLKILTVNRAYDLNTRTTDGRKEPPNLSINFELLPRLEQLDIFGCSLDSGVSKARNLWLFCTIQSKIIQEFPPSLRELWIAESTISDFETIPESVEELYFITSGHLYKSVFSESYRKHRLDMGLFPRLKVKFVDNKILKKIVIKCLGDFVGDIVLDNPLEFKNLPGLKYLFINSISDDPNHVIVIDKTPNLEELFIENSSTVRFPNPKNGFNKLRMLCYLKNEDHFPVKVLEHMKNLEKLTLASTGDNAYICDEKKANYSYEDLEINNFPKLSSLLMFSFGFLITKISSCPNLKILKAHFRFSPETTIEKCPKLERLSIPQTFLNKDDVNLLNFVVDAKKSESLSSIEFGDLPVEIKLLNLVYESLVRLRLHSIESLSLDGKVGNFGTLEEIKVDKSVRVCLANLDRLKKCDISFLNSVELKNCPNLIDIRLKLKKDDIGYFWIEKPAHEKSRVVRLENIHFADAEIQNYSSLEFSLEKRNSDVDVITKLEKNDQEEETRRDIW